MAMKIFLHGVPDTPAMWEPLIDALKLMPDDYRAPALPGFGCAIPPGFNCTKDEYFQWFANQIEAAADASGGPVDIVGHDWGAMITLGGAWLKPELVRTWTIANAAPEPTYQWHRMARMWQTPILGELIMLIARPRQMQKVFEDLNFPPGLAAQEAAAFNPVMKKAILKLYRSAKQAGHIDETELPNLMASLPTPGLVYWGEDDPYVGPEIAERFTARVNAKLELEPGIGHWAIVQRADALAAILTTHWA